MKKGKKTVPFLFGCLFYNMVHLKTANFGTEESGRWQVDCPPKCGHYGEVAIREGLMVPWQFSLRVFTPILQLVKSRQVAIV